MGIHGLEALPQDPPERTGKNPVSLVEEKIQ